LGLSNISSQILSISIHKGKIVVSGNLLRNNQLILARYNLNGTLDTTFAGTGAVLSPRIFANIYNNLGFLDDDSIIAGGLARSNKWILTKYTPSGLVDTTFGNNGYVVTNFSSDVNFAFINSIAISNNKIITAGPAFSNIDLFFTLVKYNSDGSPDLTFGNSGIVNIALPEKILINRILLQSNGKIITGGNDSSFNYAIARLNIDGSFDTTYGTNGIATANVGTSVNVNTLNILNSLAINANDDVFASGNAAATRPNNFIKLPSRFEIAKFKTDGALDNSFGNFSNGFSITDFKKVLNIPGGAENSINAIKISNGKIYTAGYTDALKPNYGFLYAVYNLNGTLSHLDTVDFSIFSPIGTTFGSYDVATSILVQPNGNYFLGGFTNAFSLSSIFSFALAKIDKNCQSDPIFCNVDVTNFGLVQNKEITNDVINSLAFQGNKIIAGGFTAPANNIQVSSFALARYNNNLSLDGTFGTLQQGIVITNFGQILNGISSFDEIFSIAIQDDNKIVAAGTTTAQNPLGDFALARYNVDGTLDRTFGNNGLVITNFPASLPGSQINSIAIQNDGKIVAGGITSNFATINPQFNFALARYNTNGTLDTTFGNNGLVVTQINPNGSNQNDQLNSLVITKNNKIIVGGTSNAQDPKFDYVLVQYNSNGSVDTSVGKKGIIFTDFGKVLKTGTRSTDIINSIALTNNGELVAGGNSDAENINFDLSLAKYRFKCIPTSNNFISALRKKFQ